MVSGFAYFFYLEALALIPLWYFQKYQSVVFTVLKPS